MATTAGYVFWCTPCKKDHAGECPPKLDSTCKGGCGRATANITGICLSCQKSSRTPTPGSRWVIQRRIGGTNAWHLPGEKDGRVVYVVTRAKDDAAWIMLEDSVSGMEWEYDLRPWTINGMNDWRFSPPTS